MRKLTNGEFLNKLYKIKGNDYKPLEDYKGAKKPIRVKHNTCGRVFETTPSNLYKGGCPECGYHSMRTKQRKSNKEFLKEVNDLVDNEYKFIDEYINNRTKLRVIHNECNYEYKVTPRDFLSGRRCPNCKNKQISKSNTMSNEDYLKKLHNKLDEDYMILSEYKNARTKIEVKHVRCGLIYKVSPHKILNGNRCPVCSFKQMGLERSKTHNQFEENVYEATGLDYEILSSYKNNRTKVLMEHKKCFNKFWVTPDSFLRGSGCPRCKESRGEKIVSKILKSMNITHTPQFKFRDCKFKADLIFDFAIKKNRTLIALIEYQGIQHYKPIKHFGGKESFILQQKKDEIKRNYAMTNKIPLIEIPYHIKNIEDYLIPKIAKLIPR